MPPAGSQHEGTRNSPERLERTFLLYAAISLLVACIVVAVAAIVPTVEHHKRHDEGQMLQVLRVRALAVEEYLSRAREIALQVGSWTEARKALIAYNEGRLSLDELQDRSEPLLMDGLVRSGEIKGITRLDARGRQVIQLGIAPPGAHRPANVNAFEAPVFRGPVEMDGTGYLLIVTPVYQNNGARAGTDLILFDMTALRRIVEESIGLGRTAAVALGVPGEKGVDVFTSWDATKGALPPFLPRETGIGKVLREGRKLPSGMVAAEDAEGREIVVAFTRIPDTNWIALLKVDRRELYESLPGQLALIALVVVPLVAVGLLGMLRLLRPLMRRMRAHRTELACEIEERKRAEADLLARAHQQSVLADLGQQMLSGLPTAELMERAVLALATTLRADFAKVLELLPDGQSLLLRAGVGWREGLVGKAAVSGGRDSQAGYTLVSDGPVVVEDLTREDRFTGPPLLLEHGVRSGVSVIIRGRKAPYGVLGVHSRQVRRFSSYDLDFVQSVANLLGGCIERSEAEGAMAENEMRLRAVFASALDPVITTNADGIVQSASDSVERCFGWHPREILGKNIDLLFREGFHREYQQDVESVLSSGESKLLGRLREITALRKDGSSFPCEISVSRVSLPGRAGIIFTTIVRDVTERRQSEEQRRQLFELIENSPEMIGLASLDGKVLYVNRAGQLLVGIDDLDHARRTTVFDYFFPEDRETVQNRIMPRLLSESGYSEGEYRLRHLRTGESIPVHSKTFLIRSPETGEPLALATVTSDLRARKKAEEDLRRSEARFRQFIESLPQGVVLHREGRIIYANPAAGALLGFDRANEMIGAAFLEFVYPDERQASEERIRSLYETGRAAPPAEVTLRNRDGRGFPAEMRALPIEFEGQRAILAVFADDTERKQLQARLLQADRLASVGFLAAGVAHEINNPLSYVIANLDFVTEQISDWQKNGSRETGAADGAVSLEEVEEILREARSGAERVKVIVQDLRTFSRTDGESTVPVDLQAVIESTINMAYRSIRTEARIVKHYGPRLHVAGSAARLGQVFMNLLQNAAQALDRKRPGGNEIRVTTSRDGRGWARVEIRDTGPGIEEEVLPRIFDPFFTTKPVGLGTGLGLSICRNIVTAMGGEISIVSRPGEGTTAIVSLPPAEAGAAGVPEGVKKLPPAEHRRLRLLLVDDDPILGASLRRGLGKRHDIVVVTEGDEAITRLREDPAFDAVLCDVMMPRRSGIEVYETIQRENPAIAERFVFMTGGAFTQKARSFLERVQNKIIEKPFAMSDILNFLEQLPPRRA